MWEQLADASGYARSFAHPTRLLKMLCCLIFIPEGSKTIYRSEDDFRGQKRLF